MTGDEHPGGVASESVPLLPPFVLSVSLAQSGGSTASGVVGVVLQGVWSVERGLWNMEAACIRHTRRSPKRRGRLHPSDLFVLSRNNPDRRPLGMIRTRLVFPNRTSHIHDSTRGRAPSTACAKPLLASVISTYAFFKSQPTVFLTIKIAGSAGLRRGDKKAHGRAVSLVGGQRRTTTGDAYRGWRSWHFIKIHNEKTL